MTTRTRVLAGLAIAVAAVGGCLDALSPRAPQRVVTVGVVPLFNGASGPGDEVPGDVDLILVTIHNPPAPDTTIAVDVEPGQDSIVIAFDVPLGASSLDTVGLSFVALHAPNDTLYTGSQNVTVRVGQPSHADSVQVRYVGPGRNIASIAIDPASWVLRPGDSLAFGFTAFDSTGARIAGMPVFWTSHDDAVAAIGSSGMARAGSEGATWIVVSSAARSSVKDSARVVVSVTPLALIGLAPATAGFTAGAGGADPAPQTVAVTNGGAGVLAALALGRVAYASGQPTGWLAASLNRSLAPATLTLQASAAGLPPGAYAASVSVASVQAGNSPQTVPVTFTVTPVPAIGLASAAETFVDTAATADPAPRTVAVTNLGTGTLGGLAVGTIAYGAGGSGWLAAGLSAATAPAMLTLTVAKASLAPGVYTATVPVTGTAANSPQSVSVTYDLRPQAAIGLGAAALAFTDTMTTGDPPAQTVAVANAGTGALGGLAVGTIAYGAGGSGWLTANLSGATAPATLTVSVAKGALGPGTYTATVPVASASANNTPQAVAVTFTIAPLPLVGLGAGAVTFVDTVLTADPPVRTVAVTNAGTGTLSGLAVGTIDYGVGPAGWLTASVSGATAPATLALSVAKGALAQGVYTATVPVTATGAGNTPQSVTVTFDLRPSPLVSMLVLPGFYVVKTADTARFFVFGRDDAGADVPALGLRYLSRTPAVATVDSVTGKVTGVSSGLTVVVVTAPGATGPVVDSALIAVPVNGQAVVAATANGSTYGTVAVGDTVRVGVGVYLGAAGGDTLVGYDAHLTWTPGFLSYVSAETVPQVGFPALVVDTSLAGSGALHISGTDPAGKSGSVVGFVYVKLVAAASGTSPLGLSVSSLDAASANLLPGALVLPATVHVK